MIDTKLFDIPDSWLAHNILYHENKIEMVSGMSKYKLLKSIIVISIVILFFSTIADASEFRTGESLVINKGEVVNDDIYFAGNTVTVEGIINGDLVAAGSEIRVAGTINGGVIAAGGTIIIDGNVTDDLRAAGGIIEIRGDIGDNVLVFGGNLVLEKGARIARDLTIGVGNAIIGGTINGNINGKATDLEMSGTTRGNVTMEIENNMRILPGAKIEGDLEYSSPKSQEIAGNVAGKTTYKETQKKTESSISGEITGYLWLLLIGILSLIFAPVISQNISDRISLNPLKSLLWGILILVVTPVIAILLLITIIGIPVSLILLAVYIIEIYVSRIFIGLWAGQYILKKLNREIRYKPIILAFGLVFVFIGINLPILGTFIHFMIIILGLGAIVLTEYDAYKKFREQRLI